MSGIFRAYDIRGIVGDDLDEAAAERVGRATVAALGASLVVVGRDARSHSPALQAALVAGIRRQGADIADLGMVSTPMFYHAVRQLGAPAGVMVTASHNPAAWNGFKVCRVGAMPLGQGTGLERIEALATAAAWPAADRRGALHQHDPRPAYTDYLRAHAGPPTDLPVVADLANGMGGLEISGLRDRLAVETLFETPDGRFPNHPANPLEPAALADLRARVPATGAAFGVAFDGDADRLGVVDEKGEIVPMDRVCGLLAGEILRQTGPAPIVCGIRCSRGVREYIAARGGRVHLSRIGHSFAKPRILEVGAVFGGELAGHYYFGDSGGAESTGRALAMLVELVRREGRPMSVLQAPLATWHGSGELNFALPEGAAAERVIAAVDSDFADGQRNRLDGLLIEWQDWWFCLRASNTEPKIRLLVEARTPASLAERQQQLTDRIHQLID